MVDAGTGDRRPAGIVDVVAERNDAGHVAGGYPADAMPPPGAYVGWFTNVYGEEALFVQERGAATAVLRHSDLGWEPVTVTAGRADGVLLNDSERRWVRACWDAAQWHRADDADDSAGLPDSAAVVAASFSGDVRDVLAALHTLHARYTGDDARFLEGLRAASQVLDELDSVQRMQL